MGRARLIVPRALWWLVLLIGLDSYLALLVGRESGNVSLFTHTAAIVTPLGPWWLWPIGAWLIAERGALGATVALAVGVLVMAWRRHGRWTGAAFLGLELAALCSYAHSHALLKDTFWTRLAVWRFIVTDWTPSTLLIGHGPFEGARRIQLAAIPLGESWPVACNEYLDVFYAFGLVGLAGLLGVLGWRWRSLLDPAWGGLLAAGLISMLSFPTIHYPLLAVVLVVGFTVARG